MENSGLGGRFMSGPNGGFLDQSFRLGNPSLTHRNSMNLLDDHDNPRKPTEPIELKSKEYLTNLGEGKAVDNYNATGDDNWSEDEKANFAQDGIGERCNGTKGKSGAPWQRMKWTDNVVQLLIAVVACVGEDGSLEGVEGLERKSGALQKKGKWKTVSKIMIAKGCHASPQQCEDKFNDLNKRYKRLNDILGRGTSCSVVENPTLMDAMPHLSAKAKDDVRKILTSKHLFYKEMCAYHNGQKVPNSHGLDIQDLKQINGLEEEEAEGNDGSDDDESDSEDDNNADENIGTMGKYDERKRIPGIEIAGTFPNPAVPLRERKEWLKKQLLELMEERVSIRAQAFELEKQRFKWLRYCQKKDEEFESLRLENERMRLVNEQSIWQLRKKQAEMHFRIPKISLEPTALGTD
ncbi:hypothetical protein K2173_011495 [Erythroxylum novogranatense]|uniref:Myb/SANT-like DNA-binding domain-containing protein n=1 Tax=Erythroxylum novogranatense TaxID=1862640 RepID=A0AAV8TWA8_9ROSI|nr:hypothetical protein K2173_011495 [Erythroxylum novogranatense]